MLSSRYGAWGRCAALLCEALIRSAPAERCSPHHHRRGALFAFLSISLLIRCWRLLLRYTMSRAWRCPSVLLPIALWCFWQASCQMIVIRYCALYHAEALLSMRCRDMQAHFARSSSAEFAASEQAARRGAIVRAEAKSARLCRHGDVPQRICLLICCACIFTP